MRTLNFFAFFRAIPVKIMSIGLALVFLLCGPVSPKSSSHFETLQAGYLSAEATDQFGAQTDTESPLTKKSVTFGSTTLSERDIRDRLLTLLATHDPQAGKAYQPILGEGAAENLGIYAQKNQPLEHTVVGRIFRGETEAGQLTLAKLLTTPTTDLRLLTKRQAVLTALIKDRQLCSQLRGILQSFGAIESDVLALSHPGDPLYDKGVLLQHHKHPFQNSDHWFYRAPLLQDIWKVSMDAWFIGGTRILYSIIPLLTGAALLGSAYKHGSWDGIADEVHAIRKSVSPGLRDHDRWGPGAIWAGGLFTIAFSLLKQADASKDSRDRIAAIHYIRTHMRPLRILFQTVDKLQKIVKRTPILQHIGPEMALFTKKSKDLQRLIKLVSSNAFTSNSYLFSRAGNIIAALPYLMRTINQIFQQISVIGTLDAYLSLATLYREHEGTDRPFSFAHYYDPHKQKNPTLEVTGLWHPRFIGQEQIMTNSFSAGTTTEKTGKDMMITGPSSTGKTALLTAATLAIIMGQTVGIVPATHCAYTPFTKINVYTNITDDLANDRSLFKAEVWRAQQLVKQIEKLGDGQFSFSILDKAFTGTEPGEGGAAAYATAKYLSRFPQSITLHATSFPYLDEIEQNTNGIVKNYHFKATIGEDKNGTPLFTNNYTLERGPSDQKTVTALLKKYNFSSDVIKTVERALKGAL